MITEGQVLSVLNKNMLWVFIRPKKSSLVNDFTLILKESR